MSIWSEMGVVEIPLFDGLKFPTYPGYRGERPLAAAAKWMDECKENGKRFVLTGRYALLNGMGVVIDLEGRKWGAVAAAVKSDALPSWLRAVRDVCNAALPTWVSAGGDGGMHIRNALLPYPYDQICDALGIPVDERVAGNTHRIAIGAEGRGELLLKCGVCIPTSEVWSADGDVRRVSWAGWVADGGDDGGPSLFDARARARHVMPDLMTVLAGAVTAAREVGRSASVGDAGVAPVIREVEVALWTGGAEAGFAETQAALERGTSRHYLAKTWANWALLSRGESLLAAAGRRGRDGALEIVARKILDTWAGEAGFRDVDVMKAVKEEARWVGFGRESS